MTDISIVIPNYNGRELLPPLLDSIRNLDYPKDNIEIIIVDDASTDGFQSSIITDYPEARLIENKRNKRFVFTANRGAREAKGRYLLFLNNDTKANPDIIKALLKTMESDPDCRSVGARMLNWDGSHILFNGGYINFEGKGFEEGCSVDSPESDNSRSEQLFSCGGAMLVDRVIFLDLGAFDEDYGMIYEDVDFGWRLNLAGYKSLFSSDAIVYHHHHASLDAISYHLKAVYFERNSLQTIYKNLSDDNLGKILPAVLLLASIRSQIFGEGALKKIQPELSFFQSRAYNLIEKSLSIFGKDGISHLYAVNEFLTPGLKEKRKNIQKIRKVNDNKILKNNLFPNPFRIWAYNDDQYKYLSDGGYEKIWQDVIDIFDLKEIFISS